MQYVETDLIVSEASNPTLAGLRERLTDLRMKKKDASWYPEFKCTYNNIKFFCSGWMIGDREGAAVSVQKMEYRRGILEIDGTVCDCVAGDQGELYVRVADEACPVVYVQDQLSVGCLTEEYSSKKLFHVSLKVPVRQKKKELEFGIRIGRMECQLDYILAYQTAAADIDAEDDELQNDGEGVWDGYDITVIYACHDRQKMEEGYQLPEQTIAMKRVEVLPVFEDDVFWPRRRSMELIDQAQGRFVIMLDENDTFHEKFLQDMITYFADSDTSFGMPSLIAQFANRGTAYFSIQKMATVAKIDTRYCQSTFPTELHGIIFETEKLQEAYHQCASLVEPEKQIYLYLLKQNPNFLYIGARAVRYGQPRECDYQYDLRCQMREWYFDSLEKFLLPALEKDRQENGSVGGLLQCLALHMLHVRIYANINNRNKHIVEPKEMDAYTKLYQDILQYVDEETIISTDSKPTSAALRNKLLDIRLKKRDFSWYPDITCLSDGVRLMCDGMQIGQQGSLKARIYLMDYKKGSLEIDGEINDFFNADHCELYAKIQDKKYPVVYNHRFASTKCFGVTFSKMKTFHVSVKIPTDVSHRLMNFYLCIGGMEYQLDYEFVGHTSRFTQKYYNSYWYFDKYMAYYDKAGIHIKNRSKKMILIRELKFWKEIWTKKPEGYLADLRLKMINFLLRPYFSKQKIWLFFDKIYKGGDSSEYMYKYAQAQKDGIKKYYLLDKSAADYKRMVKEGYKPLVRNSLKHKLVFLNANMVIASNSTVFAFNDYTAERSNLIRGDVHFDVACVQHGMSVQKIALAQQRLRDNTKLYFCASKYEIENLSKPVYDYQGYNALHLTGVPRYDGLQDRAEKVLLISPTWRMQAAMAVTKNEGVARDYNPNFKETNYYKVYNSLINDPRLLENVQKYGYRIKYVLHPIVSPQCDDFDKNEYVDIIPAIGDMSYEKVFCESALMVTDFSGVQFDFAYMRKPVVYLHHHDIPQHYEEGTYHYDTMSFGEICHTNDELIDVLIEYMKNDCKMPEMYRKRADDFFEYSDHNNCERIYKVMLEYENNR
jgi:CDP-glycerol glycerophosphotransferase (TagB/SpsB family)